MSEKREIHERPERISPYKTKKYWCPYCKKWTSTNYNENGYKCLKCCGISTKDFNVKKHNRGYFD